MLCRRLQRCFAGGCKDALQEAAKTLRGRPRVWTGRGVVIEMMRTSSLRSMKTLFQSVFRVNIIRTFAASLNHQKQRER